MYERFTDRARRSMQLANLEAQRFKHEHIGTEHMLLGLLGQGGGAAAEVLKSLGVDPRQVCCEVEKLLQSSPENARADKLPQTSRAKKVIEYSMEEARNLNHNYVGTEHILIGLMRVPDSSAAEVLTNLGLTEQRARTAVVDLLAAGIVNVDPRFRVAPQQPPSALPKPVQDELDRIQKLQEEAIAAHDFEAAAKYRDQKIQLRANAGGRIGRSVLGKLKYQLESLKERLGRDNWEGKKFTAAGAAALRFAVVEAKRLSSECIGTEHVLLGLIDVTEGLAAHALTNLGLSPSTVRSEIDQLVQCGPRMVPLRRLPRTPRAMQVIRYAREEAQTMNRSLIDTQDILCGILRENEGVAHQVLLNLGVTLDQAREEISRLGG